MVKILITGGAGFIGSNLASEAMDRGYDITIFDDFSLGRPNYITDLNVKICQGDIVKIAEYLPDDYKPDYVFHLAASGNVIQSINDPIGNFNINVTGTLSVLNFCRKAEVKRIFFSSTGGALMGDAKPPVNETSVPKPISPYGASKLACEGYINAYHKSYGLDYSIFRFGNVLGKNCLHKVGVVNKFHSKLKENKNIEIFGNVSRDFIYVQDLVNAMLTALNKEEAINEIFHLASGIEVKISDLAEIVISAMRKNDKEIIFRAPRIGEVERNFADIEKAKSVLGLQNSKSIKKLVCEVIEYLDAN